MNTEAGVWVRLGAMLLDGIIIGIPLAIVSQFISDGSGNEMFTESLSFLYYLLLPIIWGGYTVGKRICGIRIRKVNDFEPPTIGTMLMRNVVAGIVYTLTLGIGVIVSVFMVALREDKRAIHDFIAGTEVVHD